jgi:transketolase
MAWAWAVGKSKGPNVLVFTRQKLDPIPRAEGFDPHEIWRGAYVLDRYREGDITIIATGSEVPLAIKTADLIGGARVVSAPSLDLFDRQDVDYQNQVLGNRSRVVAIEAGRSSGWYKYVNRDALVSDRSLRRFRAVRADCEHLRFTRRRSRRGIREWRSDR